MKLKLSIEELQKILPYLNDKKMLIGVDIDTASFEELTLETINIIKNRKEFCLGSSVGMSSFRKLKFLTEDVANILGSQKTGSCANYLCLDSLVKISPEVAKQLIKWRGFCIHLDGLKELPEDVAEILLSWKNKLKNQALYLYLCSIDFLSLSESLQKKFKEFDCHVCFANSVWNRPKEEQK